MELKIHLRLILSTSLPTAIVDESHELSLVSLEVLRRLSCQTAKYVELEEPIPSWDTIDIPTRLWKDVLTL